MTKRLVPAAALAALLAGFAFAGHAEEQQFPCSLVMDPNDAPIIDARLDHLIVGGVHVNVLRPPGYRGHGRRYPVAYLFHGAFGDEDSWTTQTDLIAWTATLPPDQQAILVMPDFGHLPAARDWADGSNPQETYFTGTLVPFIDAHYRTLADRSQRAVAGFSGGGLDTMILAERHPDLFVAAGSFSGFLDPYSEVGQAVVQEFASLDQDLCGATYGWTAIWGDPAQHPMGWEGHDPLYLPASLADTSVYLAVGNGAPCPSDVDPDPQLETIEGIALGMAQSFDAALTASGVRHTVNYRSCGLHQFAHAGDDLKDFWPQMQRAFGDHAPREFDFSTGDASAGVYGWTFTADAARAPEFLSFTNVSRAGLRATGSGKTVVTTAALFEPGQYVLVWAGGLSLSLVRADRDGRATFTIDLGRAHTLELGTPEELAAAAADPRYFTTRQVALLGL